MTTRTHDVNGVLSFHAAARSAALLAGALTACHGSASGEPGTAGAPACQDAPQVLTTAAGVAFVRTPEACFAGLDGFPYAPKYVEIDGLRQAYLDEGPEDAAPIVLLHGQPSWSYLYRKMIPVLVAAGHRVIAMDHLGMGRSDKPTEVSAYSYLGHADRLARFLQALRLSNVTLFVQDWGSLIGLHVAGEHPEWFARIAVGDGTLPVVPAGFMSIPPIADPDTPDPSAPFPFASMPAQQVPFYGACGDLLSTTKGDDSFAAWATYAMKNPRFHPAEVVEALTWFPLPAAASAAYDAPFPRREYMAGVRAFPSLVDQLGGANDRAWAGLKAYTKPFLTVWSKNDPGNLGRFATQRNLIDNVPGAKGQPHTRLEDASHFLQDDQGPRIAALLNEWIAGTARAADFPPAGGACASDGGAPDAGTIACTSPAGCDAATPVCCATLSTSAPPATTCATAPACPTSLTSAPKTVRFCATSSDCGLEPAYPQCCAFARGGATVRFCASTALAGTAGGTCP